MESADDKENAHGTLCTEGVLNSNLVYGLSISVAITRKHNNSRDMSSTYCSRNIVQPQRHYTFRRTLVVR